MEPFFKDQKEIPTGTKRMLKDNVICGRAYQSIMQIYSRWTYLGSSHFVFDDQKAGDRFVLE